MCIASIYWRKSLLHGVVRLTAAYRPIDGRCLEQSVYGRPTADLSKSLPKTSRQSVSPVQHLRKIKIPKCPPTDNRNKICLPMARRWSRVVRRAIQRLFKLKKSAFDAEKNTFITWPDGHKISRTMKKDVDIGQDMTSWTADCRPDNQLFASKTIGRWSLSEMGLWYNPQSLLLPELISCV